MPVLQWLSSKIDKTPLPKVVSITSLSGCAIGLLGITLKHLGIGAEATTLMLVGLGLGIIWVAIIVYRWS